MRNFLRSRYWVILLSVVAVIAIATVASGLGEIHFQPSQPLSVSESISIQISVDRIAEELGSIPFWKQLIFWLLAFVLVLMIASLFSPELRKRIIMSFIRFAIFVILVFYLLKNFRNLFPSFNLGGFLSEEGAGVDLGGELSPPVFIPPEDTPLMTYLASLVVVLVLAGVVFLLVRWWSRRRRRGRPSPLEDIATIAQSSLAALRAGKNWEDVIIQCYARMSEVVGLKRGLLRQPAMTPSEFAARLERAGLPGEAVRQLTQLFESVRYGDHKSSSAEVDKAIACLTTIQQYCGAE